MKNEIMGVVGGVVVAMINKGMFNELKTQAEREKAIVKTIVLIGDSFA